MTLAEKRVVLVTGAGNGLGAAFARACAQSGARVIVNNRHRGAGEPSAERVAALLRSEGHEAVADLHAIDAPHAAADIIVHALTAFGRLDAVILNAGISGSAATIDRMTDADLAEVMSINFFASAALARTALKPLAISESGWLLFVSSTAGLHGLRGRAHYAASKGALNGFALSLASEQRRAGIGVNILMPYAATAMTKGIGQETLDCPSSEHLAQLAA